MDRKDASRAPPDQYERDVRDIVASLVALAHPSRALAPGCGRTNHVVGASGHHHQIDVSFRLPTGLFLIECKQLNSAIETSHVLAFHGRIHDVQDALPEGTGILASLVTTVGAQSGAERLARYFGIHLDIVRSATDYAVRYRHVLGIGVSDGVIVGDSASIEVDR